MVYMWGVQKNRRRQQATFREFMSTPCHTPMAFAHEIIIEKDDKLIEGQCYEF
jgi:hypothetical protein